MLSTSILLDPIARRNQWNLLRHGFDCQFDLCILRSRLCRRLDLRDPALVRSSEAADEYTHQADGHFCSCIGFDVSTPCSCPGAHYRFNFTHKPDPSASIATIVRIPYVSTMGNTADFLYATTDVAIWSCAESGLSIAASSFATLKPLFKTFMSRSRLFGGTTVPLSQNKWPQRTNTRPSKGCYIRSRSGDDSMETGRAHDSTTNITKTFEVNVRHYRE